MNTIETGPSDNARDSEMWSRSWTHFSVDRRSARYCHVTFDHPPINTITGFTVVRSMSSYRGRVDNRFVTESRLAGDLSEVCTFVGTKAPEVGRVIPSFL